MKKVTNKNKTLKFNSEKHEYKVGRTKYVSVTTIIGEQFPKFDADEVAERVALKQKRSPASIKKEWADKGAEACRFGTKIHKWAEDILNKLELSREGTEKELAYLKSLEEFIPKFLKKYEIIEAEKMIFSPKYKIAGTIDLLARNKKTGKIHVLDWKTNKAIERENRWQKGKGKDELSHLDSCNFNKYSLQLNLYQRLLKEEYFEDAEFERYILHIDAEKVHVIKSPSMNKEINIILGVKK
jgi:ATP-dependent exoDNAse (exonuclease V) beta subunit